MILDESDFYHMTAHELQNSQHKLRMMKKAGLSTLRISYHDYSSIDAPNLIIKEVEKKLN